MKRIVLYSEREKCAPTITSTAWADRAPYAEATFIASRIWKHGSRHSIIAPTH
jgi:hypothetical protein